MDRAERFDDLNTAVLNALAGWQAALWTALPAIVENYDPIENTITAQPTIQGRVQAKDGSFSWVTMPLLVDVPVVFPSGGGLILTFPITQGDEALIVFSSRCIDSWWQLGGVQVQAELRMHDLSDGFAFVGPRSQARPIPNISTTNAQLRNQAGTAYIELTPAGVVNIKCPGGFNVVEGAANFASTIDAADKITAPVVEGTEEVIFGGITGTDHEHSGVTPGGGTSGPPVP